MLAGPQAAAAATMMALTFAVGLGVGYGMNVYRKRQSLGDKALPPSSSITANICECGFDLTGKAPHHVEAHKAGALHRSNLYRSKSASRLLVTAKINEYRSAISTNVIDTDVILEIGCAEGLTTQRLAQRARIAIGVDLYSALIEKARKRVGQPLENASAGVEDRISITKDVSAPEGKGWTNLHFHTVDAFDTAALLSVIDQALGIDHERAKRDERARIDQMVRNEVGESENMGKLSRKARKAIRRKILSRDDYARHQEEERSSPNSFAPTTGRMYSGRVNKIWLDISGSRETRTVVHLIDILDSLLRPELIVVKSDRLKALVLRSYLPSSSIPGITHAEDKSPYLIN